MADIRKFLRLAIPACVVLGLTIQQPRATDLGELYARAIEFDPQFQAARYTAQIAEEGIRQARSGILPGLSATAQGGQVFQDIKSSDSILFTEGRTDYSNVDLSLVLTQPLYRSETYIELQQARTQRREAGFELAAAELIYRLAQAHFDYLAADDELEFASTERQAIGRQLQETEQRQAAGLETITAVHEIRARFALAQAAEIDAGDALEAATRAIAEITGMVPVDLETLSDAYPLVEPDRPDVELWVETALFQNPKINALEAQLQVVEQDIRRQRNASRVPSVDLVGTFSNSDTGGTEFGGGREIVTNNVGVRVSIPIYDGGRSGATLRTGELQYQQTLQRVELERRRVEREARDAFRSAMSSIIRVEALRQSVFSQEAVLSEKEEGLRAGLSTSLAVLDARRDLFSARRDLARARYLHILASLRLKQAAGILSGDDLRQIDAFLQ
jgi:outer membrane protein